MLTDTKSMRLDHILIPKTTLGTHSSAIQISPPLRRCVVPQLRRSFSLAAVPVRRDLKETQAGKRRSDEECWGVEFFPTRFRRGQAEGPDPPPSKTTGQSVSQFPASAASKNDRIEPDIKLHARRASRRS